MDIGKLVCLAILVYFYNHHFVKLLLREKLEKENYHETYLIYVTVILNYVIIIVMLKSLKVYSMCVFI